MFNAETDVHVWQVEVDDELSVRRALALLPPGERDRLNRLAQPHRRRAIGAHAALRLLAAAVNGGRRPLPELARAGNGKPYLTTYRRWHVSLSHAGARAAIALTTAAAVGVDIEPLTPVPEGEALARTVLAATEYDQWRTAGAPARTPLLLQAWTRKEAVLKALGTGLAGGMSTVATGMSVGGAGPVRVDALPAGAGSAGRWTVRDLPGGDGYVGAVAVRAPGVRLRAHRTSIHDLLAAAPPVAGPVAGPVVNRRRSMREPA